MMCGCPISDAGETPWPEADFDVTATRAALPSQFFSNRWIPGAFGV
jgi:hypothetical protein